MAKGLRLVGVTLNRTIRNHAGDMQRRLEVKFLEFVPAWIPPRYAHRPAPLYRRGPATILYPPMLRKLA